ncbi:MAG TPA: acylphosphatase [Methylococcaceae bacterium]|nr:acylphosphatase [Methylococcaceae bacterium]HIL39995.1 acylphosphatase [Methylococcales bacterium]
MKQHLKIYISGHVQGVFFRVSTQKKAHRFGITGWVRNCADGRVEIDASGEQTDMEKFINWCYQGPDSAHVSQVSTQTLPDAIASPHFKIH